MLLRADRTQALPWLVGATMCLYAGGVVLNDFFDRRLDAIERPERPIPSRRVSAASAAALGTTPSSRAWLPRRRRLATRVVAVRDRGVRGFSARTKRHPVAGGRSTWASAAG
jgi:hypothetical protein